MKCNLSDRSVRVHPTGWYCVVGYGVQHPRVPVYAVGGLYRVDRRWQRRRVVQRMAQPPDEAVQGRPDGGQRADRQERQVRQPLAIDDGVTRRHDVVHDDGAVNRERRVKSYLLGAADCDHALRAQS